MDLPPWLTDRERKRRQNARSRAQEASHAKAVGGRPQAGSGSSWKAPGDVVSEEYLDECKFTDKASFSIRRIDWEAIRRKALRMGREPRMVIEINGGHGGKIKLMVTEILD